MGEETEIKEEIERVWTFDISNFKRVEKEIKSIKEELSSIKLTINSLNQVLSKVNFPKPAQSVSSSDIQQTQEKLNSTDTKTIGFREPIKQTINLEQEEKQSIQQTIRHISTRNDGVPTDNSTDIQQTDKTIKIPIKSSFKISDRSDTTFNTKNTQNRKNIDIKNLDSAVFELKQDLLNKFKELSQQEFKVFSAIYSLEESEQILDYALLSAKLNLTESSIRDYIMKLEKKGIPIIKEKLKNRRVSLHIRKELRDIFTLDKLLKIRESSSLRQVFSREFQEKPIREEFNEELKNNTDNLEGKTTKAPQIVVEELNEPLFY